MKLIPLKTTNTYKIHIFPDYVGKIDYNLSQNKLTIKYIIIYKKYRKKGYAKKAIKLLLKKYKNNFSIETTSVGKGNKASNKLWKSLGFKRYGKIYRL